MKLNNGVTEGGLCGIEGRAEVWMVDRITLRGQVYVRHPETGEVLVVTSDKVHPHKPELYSR